MSSIKPDDGGGEIHSAKEGFGAFIVSGGDGAVLFEFGEEILDQMSGFVQFFIVCTRLFPVFLWRDDALDACLFQQIKNALLRVIGFVGQKCLHACEKIRQQGIGSFQIVRLPRCEMKTGWITQGVARRVNFCGQPALAAPDALLRVIPLFAPAAC